jgi:hypothetical protein
LPGKVTALFSTGSVRSPTSHTKRVDTWDPLRVEPMFAHTRYAPVWVSHAVPPTLVLTTGVHDGARLVCLTTPPLFAAESISVSAVVA